MWLLMCVCTYNSVRMIILFKIVKILNLFITYGDTFLPNPTTYDELYYELIRVNKVFDDLYTIGQSALCVYVCSYLYVCMCVAICMYVCMCVAICMYVCV